LEDVEDRDDLGSLRSLLRRLAVEIKDPTILETSLTHRSWAYEREVRETNERLELLGDAVLNLCVTDLIYARFPLAPEGDLAKLRASLVSEPALAEVARELDLGAAIRLGRGEELTGGREKPSILSDCLEAVIGAIYIDRGIRTARAVVRRLFDGRVRGLATRAVPKDPKTHLQEVVTRRFGNLPRYRTMGEGPDHAKEFRAQVFVNDVLYGRGQGRSKKEAEQGAAASALERLATEDEPDPGVVTHA
jgi:ribonuclease III